MTNKKEESGIIPPDKSSAQTVEKAKKLTKLIVKGTIPLDLHVTHKNSKVFSEKGEVYAATLNQSNVQHNNNKFYILQVLQSEPNPDEFYFFTRWGRVGQPGKSSEVGPLSKSYAISQYYKKLNDKTSDSSGYRLVEMNYNEGEQVAQSQPSTDEGKKTDTISCSIDSKVQNLMKLIFDMQMMNNQMKQIGYDSSKMPLGKLAKSSIMKGYQALNKLMQQIKEKPKQQVLTQQSSEFYSYIPHDFGFRRMSNYILDSEKKIKDKLEMLQSLEDIKIYTSLISQKDETGNQIESNYLKLKTGIFPVKKDSQEFEMIERYVRNTHGPTHTSFSLKIQEVFAIRKQEQERRFRKSLHNKQLLWHGSRLTNYVGILTKGLRIAPPQAPVTGYMFGKGVYFSDMVSKSANYCHTSKTNSTGLMLLCQVALGNMNEKYFGDYHASNLPSGKHSTKAFGKMFPDGGQDWKGLWVPNGDVKTSNSIKGDLVYNEYIVYDLAQIFGRYLLRLKFMHR